LAVNGPNEISPTGRDRDRAGLCRSARVVIYALVSRGRIDRRCSGRGAAGSWGVFREVSLILRTQYRPCQAFWRRADTVQSSKDRGKIVGLSGFNQPEPDEPSEGAVLHFHGNLSGASGSALSPRQPSPVAATRV
jgi:hypothetical protein